MCSDACHCAVAGLAARTQSGTVKLHDVAQGDVAIRDNYAMKVHSSRGSTIIGTSTFTVPYS